MAFVKWIVLGLLCSLIYETGKIYALNENIRTGCEVMWFVYTILIFFLADFWKTEKDS